MNTHYFKMFCAFLALAFSLAGTKLSAAPDIKIGDKGVAIENSGLKCILTFPVPVDAAQAKGKVSETIPSDGGVTLKYEGGGQLDLKVAAGEVILKPTGLPDGTQSLFLSMRLDMAMMSGGKWQFGSQTGTFPAQETSGQIHQATVAGFSAVASSGPSIALSLPASSFQQLMDLRQFQQKAYFWQCWLPYAAGTETFSIKISDASGSPASASAAEASPAPASPAAAPPADPAPASTPTPAVQAPADLQRQKFGQLSGMPEDKKSGTRILKWKDGKRAAFLLGFDDNGGTLLSTVIPELEKRKMPGNFYVNPGTGHWKKNEAQWQEAAKSPYVFLHNHTFLHNGAQTVEGFEEDVLKTTAAILAITPHLKSTRIMVFRQPGGVSWKISKDETKAVLAKHHMFNRPWLDGPPLSMKSLEATVAPVEWALGKGATGLVDFHGVGGDPNPAPVEWFTALLDKLDEHREQFWIADTLSWYQYQEERKKSELKVVQADDTQVRLSLACSCDPDLFDLPLTLAVEVPSAWKACTVTQGAKTWQATADGGEIRFDALPGADEIVIKPQ